MKRVYEISGDRFSSLEEFYEEISRKLIPGTDWGKNLDAFNDILRGGFGTPPEGFILRWNDSIISRQRLGYPETIRQLNLTLEKCHASNRRSFSERLRQAEARSGDTVFDWLVEIILSHSSDGVELELR